MVAVAIDTTTVGTKISISTVVVIVAAVTRSDPETIAVMVIAVRRKLGTVYIPSIDFNKKQQL